MSAAERQFEHHQDACIYLRNGKNRGKVIKSGYCKALSLEKKVCKGERTIWGSICVDHHWHHQSTSSIVHKLHTFSKASVTYRVLCLVMHQGICIFPAETLLMLMMLDQNLSSNFVSIFNALFSRCLETTFCISCHFDHFPCVFDVFWRIHMAPSTQVRVSV